MKKGSAAEIRDIVTRAFGHEFIKPKYEAIKEDLSKSRTEHSTLIGQIGDLRSMYQRGDLDGFFQRLNIPEQAVLKYALDKLNYQDLPPDQKQALDARRTAERQNYQLQQHTSQLEQKFQEQMTQSRVWALDAELAGSAKSMVDSFDQRFGPGAFRNAVVERGQLAWFQKKVDLSPSQAVQEVIKHYGLGKAQASAAPVPAAPASATVQRPSTIPNVGGGRVSSPMKQKPRSIEDLKRIAAEM